jgi:hypothetical protein
MRGGGACDPCVLFAVAVAVAGGVVWCVQKLRDVENVTQVMWPSQYFSWMVTGGCLLAHLAGLGSSHDVCRWRAAVLLQARCTAVRCSSRRW